MKTIKQIALLCTLSFLVAFGVLAAPTKQAAPAMAPETQDAWSTLGVVVLVPILIAIGKKALKTAPDYAWPVVAVVLGVVLNALAVKAGYLSASDWRVGALCGLAGVGLRELVVQLRQFVPAQPAKK
jgi:ABC-type iron transport system FetAB permease component